MKTNRLAILSLLSIAFLFSLLTSFAGPVAKVDPVNENFPVWTGVVPKNYIAGRSIVPSDLRQRATIVVEFQMEKISEQFPKFMKWAPYLPLTGEGVRPEWSPDWMHKDVHTKGILVFSNRGQAGKKTAELWEEELKKLGKDAPTSSSLATVPIYNNIAFEGGPDAGGKYPFVYVMGPSGKEPLLQCPIAELKKGELRDAILKAKKDMPDFKPFFGPISEPQFAKTFAAAVAKGKPITPLQKSLLAKVKSGNAEEAKEAQILYDSLEQTKSDLILKMRQESAEAPYCAINDFNVLGRYWPAAKKEVVDFIGALQKNPEIAGLGQMYTKIATWADPNFKPKKSDIKGIKGQILKFKKALAPLKESKNITVQNAALMIDGELDTIASSVESKVQ